MESRRFTFVGMGSFEDAIDSLYDTDSTPQTTLAKNLIVVVQMISEVTRFNPIEAQLRKTIARHDDLLPDSTMLSLEGSWASLCRAVQESNNAGSFLRMFCNGQLTSRDTL